MDARTNPYAVLMGKLTGINAPPKARQAFQQYMRESYDADIAPVVQARFATERDNIDGQGSGATQKGPNAPFRARVARELFAELSEDEQQALRERAKHEAKGARDEYDLRRKAPPSKKPEDRQKCIDNIGTFMAPILRGIEEYTGLHSVVIFGGPMPRHGGELRTVHVSHGRSQDGAHALFPQWAKARFNKDVLELIHEYLRAAFTECAEAAMPVDEDGEPGASRAKGKALDDLDSSSSSSSDSDEEGQQSDDSSNVTSEDEDNGAMKGGKERTKMEGKATAEPKVKQSGPKKIGGQRPGKGRATEGAPSRKRKHGEQDEDEEGVGEGEKSGDVAARKRKRKSVGAKEESDEGITESGGNGREYSTAIAGRSSAEADVAAAKKKATTGKNSPPAAASGAGGGDGRNTNGHPPLSDTVSCLLGAAQWPTSSDRAPLWGSPESEPQTE
ncbi:hypothetical protein C8R46DRAFT_1205198 [Mycena filopes]|nr:hypothetical protein C8R46DRAFT_1205198 [Mycena filopes]